MTEGVGTFLGHAAASRGPGTAITLLKLCTEPEVWCWIDAMRARHLQPATIRTRVVGLLRGAVVMHPLRDWRWLHDVVAELPTGRLESRRRKLPLIRDVRELIRLGVQLIADSTTGQFLRPELRHVQARDGTIIAFLATTALRRKNLTALRIGVHLLKQTDGTWRLKVPPSETKNREAIDRVLPAGLGYLLERYINVDRAALVARRQDGRADDKYMWLTEDGTPISAHNLKERVRMHTKRQFGVAISPHRFRDAGVTTMAVTFPTDYLGPLALLADRDPKTVQSAYDQSTSLEASRKIAKSIAATKAELGIS